MDRSVKIAHLVRQFDQAVIRKENMGKLRHSKDSVAE
jgi:hypothetical protein